MEQGKTTLTFLSKVCIKCGIDKPLSHYYKHKQMKDGHLNKCKTCTKKDVATRDKLKRTDIDFVLKERNRGREKYHRLGYKNKPQTNKDRSKNWRNKYPEKYEAHKIASHLPRHQGKELHHWSYNKEHYKDVIELTIKEHNLLHRHLTYDQDTFMYKTLDGILLDTKIKHILYFYAIKLNPVN